MNGRHPAAQAMPPDMGRRRPYGHHQSYQPVAPMYNGYYQPYAASYYPQMQPQYPNGAMPPAQYNPYQAYGRSPPPQMPPYVSAPPPMPAYQRQHSSPVPVATYNPPPPHTPASSQSSYVAQAPLTPPTPQTPQIVASEPTPEPAPVKSEPFQPPLPWFSRPDLSWPTKQARIRRKRRPQTTEAVELTSSQPKAALQSTDSTQAAPEPSEPAAPAEEAPEEAPVDPAAQQETVPQTPEAASPSAKPKPPILPVVPAIPRPTSKDSSVKAPESQSGAEIGTTETSTETAPIEPSSEEAKASVARPSLWTGLFKATSASAARSSQDDTSSLNFQKSTSESMAEVLHAFSPTARESLAFLQPRGLVNTGNMCYMNSVLQVLVFCIPFFSFLDQVGKRAAHSFKSDTPLIDAMIMFMKEFPVIASAQNAEQLQKRLKDGELEQYGDPFIPEFVYDVIRRLPRFSSMRRGHQQDAEEFLGFLLEGLHDECAQAMRTNASNGGSALGTPANGPASPVSEASVEGVDGAWLEVGPKQKAAVTRSSGSVANTPITKIFGGTLRSELRVPGLKNSVTLEPYQPLQLDIGDPQINSIIDALKGLTRPEVLHGDFKSPKGAKVTATKQVFIETLPPVLILHLKRFQYDNTGGTQKIWKKIDYPLDLEIPKEVFSRQQQGRLLGHGGLPRYRLTAVVYHHGKNASGGHYTVDVRRQDGREWIRLDDTVIRRVRSEDVAQAGSEGELENQPEPRRENHSGNIFDQINVDGEDSDGEGWKQVSGAAGSDGKKWSSLANGSSTPKTKSGNSSIKDHEVPYLLFYEKMN